MRKLLLVGLLGAWTLAFAFTKSDFLNFPRLPEGALNKNQKIGLSADPSLSKNYALSQIDFISTADCSNGVVVAVVDTGIDYTHPKLKNSLWVNQGEVGPWTPPKGNQTTCKDKSCNGIDDDKNGYADDVIGWDFVNEVPLPYDVHGHGTHIAGLIAAIPELGSRVSGVCPLASIMALKYYDNSGMGYNNLQNTIRAFNYATKMGAKIINYSGGGLDPALPEHVAVKKAANAGILIVTAAGNEGNDRPYFPGSYPEDNLIRVASLNPNGELLPSSSFGAQVPLAAPGLQVLSTLPSGRYGTMSGTSQATALVSGAAAFLLSRNPNADYKTLKSWLIRGAKPLKSGKVSAGILSVSGALKIQKSR